MTEMAMGPEVPEVPRSPGAAGGRGAVRTAAWCLALLAGSVLLGLLCGVIWSEIAPRALLEEVGKGTAEVVNVETRAFFGADVWFCAIAAAAGLLTGLLGYPLAVARHDGYARAAVTLALILGALAGGLAMLWLGDRLGSSAYQHQLASSASGTLFYSSLSLGAKSALALWPLLTGVVLLVAEWGRRPEPAGQPAGQPA